MKKIIISVVLIAALVSVMLFAGCTEAQQPGTRAQNVLESQPTEIIKQSNERDIFAGYLKQVSNPNNIQWIYCMSWDGHVIFRCPVKGKVISATKSSDPYERVGYSDSMNNEWYEGKALPGAVPGTLQLMNPSGMYGHDTPGAIWQDPQGNYYEWHEGPYFVSDIPLKLGEPVLSLSNVDYDLLNKARAIENNPNATAADLAGVMV